MTTTATPTLDPVPSARSLTRTARALAGVGAVVTGLGGLAVLGVRVLLGAHRYEQGGTTLRFPVSGWISEFEGAVSAVEVPWVGLTDGENARLVAAYVLDALWVPLLLVLVCGWLVRVAAGRPPGARMWRLLVSVGVVQFVASVVAAALRADVMPGISARVLAPALPGWEAVADARVDVEAAGSLMANLAMSGVVVGLVVVVAGLVLALASRSTRQPRGLARESRRPAPLPRRVR